MGGGGGGDGCVEAHIYLYCGDDSMPPPSICGVVAYHPDAVSRQQPQPL